MAPQIPGYLVAFDATLRPLVAALALGLIWMGALRMQAPAQSRYTTAGALSVALIAWLAVAQYLGSANTYFANTESGGPMPMRKRCGKAGISPAIPVSSIGTATYS